MRKAFTLIELMISIVILTILMLFLYKSYASLNKSNLLLSKEVIKISKIEKLKKLLYLDISLTMKDSLSVIHQSKKEDILFFQTTHSIHNNINPYIAYIFKDKKLYRLESLKKFTEYPLAVDSEFTLDELGRVKTFRVYKSKSILKSIYLVNILFEDSQEILLKVKVLNN